ncbi:BBP7 family outer membrane beta-barrel protein [Urbifossiella limnaea]|uniref:Long-chain fatty acid transport protein n=1 Tax=Urbifossiella limnaea TaxID=2528023 RepID=A0A517XX03_9BACT|nr:BBP7 family outer membrane beta-barrel protein [Urbifossiella limnaea]QDU22004.1 hypothetical protein ETAA1_39790 [Urbifossiella limnaea]
MRHTALLVAAVCATATTGTAADFGNAIFAAPTRSSTATVVPGGGPLVAPAITPTGTTHFGRQEFELIPAGWEREPFFTRDPGRYTSNACDSPVQCSAVGFVALDFLLWATQGPGAPAVVTTGPAVLGPGFAGTPGVPGTVALFGGSRVLNDVRPGFRFDFFLPVAADGRWGVGTRFEMLGASADSLAAVADGTTVLNVPQSVGGLPVPVYVGFPGQTAGTVTASTHTNYLGGDVHLRRNLWAGDTVRLDGVLGYRYLHLGDRIASSWDVFGPTAPPPLGGRVMADDGVRTRNDFNGGLLGLAPTANFGRFSVTGRMAVALGTTTSERDVTRTRVVVPGLTNGGLAGLTPVTLVNVGARDQQSDFAVAPEFGLKFGWRAADALHLTAGYSFQYWSRVRRAQEHFDLGGFAANPTTDFWAQGLSLGLELRY